MAPSPFDRNADEPVEILIVEDNPGDVRLLREAFGVTERETTLRTATNGDDAVDYLTRESSADEIPDLVLLDLNLPGRDGCDVLEAIRDDPHLEGLPVIMLTSSEAEEDVARCYSAGSNAYLTKPTTPEGLVSTVEYIEEFWIETSQLPPAPAR